MNRFHFATTLLLASVAASATSPATKDAQVIDRVPGLSFREALFAAPPEGIDTSRRVWAVAMDMRPAGSENAMTIVAFADGSSAHSGSLWEHAYIGGGAFDYSDIVRRIVSRVQRNRSAYGEGCDRNLPPAGTARVTAFTRDGLACLSPVPLDFLDEKPGARFEIHRALADLWGKLHEEDGLLAAGFVPTTIRRPRRR